MKFFLLWLAFWLGSNTVHAQFIRVNGDVTTHEELPIEGVLVMAFDRGTLLKSYVTDDKGQYSFNVDKMIFDVMFYKPGLHAHSYRLNNRLDKETQGIYVDIQMDDSTAETAVQLPLWLKQHQLTATYMDSLYNDKISKLTPPAPKHKSKKEIQKEALAEQKRFANYKQSTVTDSVNNEESQVTTTVIGPDTYERITSERGEKKYFKNSKPITEVTYRFETTRRYDGVLKSTKNVKKIEKYQPQLHVKG